MLHIYAEDIEKALATLDMIVFVLQDDIDRPVYGIEEKYRVPAGTFASLEEAKDALINEARQIPEIDAHGVFYSTMLGLYDDDHHLVFAITYSRNENAGSFDIYDPDDPSETREVERYVLPK